MRGVFALSNNKEGLEVVRSADRSANEEIKGFFTQFKYFWFELASSPREAYSIECELYHSRLVTKNNATSHPKAPSDSGWRCPVCTQ
jgi:hypothetical protein